jgi:hypothetical protein
MVLPKDFFERKLEIRHIPALIDFIIKNEDWYPEQSCKAAAIALGELGEPAITAIRYAIKKSKLIGDNEKALLSSLKYITDINAIESLIDILRKNEFGQENAAYALGQIGDTRAIDTLIFSLQDESRPSETQKAIIEALGMFNDVSIVQPLITVLRKTKYEAYDLKLTVIQALGRICDRCACEPIIDTLFNGIGIYFSKDGDQWLKIIQHLQNIFLDYTWIIINSIEFSSTSVFDEEASKWYDKMWDSVNEDQRDLLPKPHVDYNINIENNLKALDFLCKNNTPISSNLLHKIKEIKLVSWYSNMDKEAVLKALGKLKQIAEEELNNRGNPKYDEEAYFQEGMWRINDSRNCFQTS